VPEFGPSVSTRWQASATRHCWRWASPAQLAPLPETGCDIGECGPGGLHQQWRFRGYDRRLFMGGGFNAFPALKDGDFCNQRAAFRPEKKVHRSVGIPIMLNTTARANPLSHSTTCVTFRAAARTARRTGLGSPSLIDFDIPRPVPHGLPVAEHRAEAGPRCIEHRLSQLRLCHRPRVGCQPGFRHPPHG
jgi:hypothetical protein